MVKMADKIFGGIMRLDKKSGIFRLEQEVVTQCGISRERFRKSEEISGKIYIRRLQKNMRIRPKYGKMVCIGQIPMAIVPKA